ncbi:MAG TPA: hypothetical protein VLJ59_03695 [Mycobacteriales bacterium]|nr:hypothetical protein [Mycobacteriales bacterium]
MDVTKDATKKAGSELDFVDPHGRRQSWTVHYGPSSDSAGTAVRSRTVTSDGGRTVVQRWVPAELATRVPASCDPLENEVRAGVRLAGRFRDAFPTEVVRLIGYDLDRAEPFLLLSPYRGVAVAEVAGRLGLAEQRQFEVSLFRSLLLLAEADIVHAGLTSTAVRWDGKAVQISDFSYAAVVGDPRVARRESAWASPNQRAGTGVAEAADDIWAAGMVVLHAVSGRADPLPDLAGRGPALQNLLRDVFAADGAQRPSAADLLRRLDAHTYLPPAADGVQQAFAEGRQVFDRVLTEKWPPTPTVALLPAPELPRHRMARGQIALLVAAVLVVATGVAVAMALLFGGSR